MAAAFPSPYQRNQTPMLTATRSTTAEQRFRWLENRLEKNDDLKQQYKEFICEMIEMERLEPAKSSR